MENKEAEVINFLGEILDDEGILCVQFTDSNPLRTASKAPIPDSILQSRKDLSLGAPVSGTFSIAANGGKLQETPVIIIETIELAN